jgi:hypothetical protein
MRPRSARSWRVYLYPGPGRTAPTGDAPRFTASTLERALDCLDCGVPVVARRVLVVNVAWKDFVHADV